MNTSLKRFSGRCLNILLILAIHRGNISRGYCFNMAFVYLASGIVVFITSPPDLPNKDHSAVIQNHNIVISRCI